MTYSIDFRKKLLKAKAKEGLSFEKIAARFCVSKAAVVRWSKNLKTPNKRNKPWKKLDKEALKKDILEFPDSYCYERAKRLGVSPSGIRYAKKRLGVSYKKTLNHPKVGESSSLDKIIRRSNSFCTSKPAKLGDNSWKIKEYKGPCPPTGEHIYYFKLFALNDLLEP